MSFEENTDGKYSFIKFTFSWSVTVNLFLWHCLDNVDDSELKILKNLKSFFYLVFDSIALNKKNDQTQELEQGFIQLAAYRTCNILHPLLHPQYLTHD